jgi:hypothetical protein
MKTPSYSSNKPMSKKVRNRSKMKLWCCVDKLIVHLGLDLKHFTDVNLLRNFVPDWLAGF